MVKFYLVSRKKFHINNSKSFFFALQIIEGHTSFCLYCIILCCWIKHTIWHSRVAIQFEYCFPIIGLCIDIYEYGMLSMGFNCCLEEEITFNKSLMYIFISKQHTSFSTKLNENIKWLFSCMILPSVSVSVDEFLPIKAHLNIRGRLIHHYNNYDA
jgi:hypothetical protein